MKVKVKICGIRSRETAQAAITAGADFIGLNFVSSSNRSIDFSTAQTIARFAKEKIAIVGVFRNEDPDSVNAIADLLSLDFVQLHGEEDNEYIKKINLPVIKSVHSNSLPKLTLSEFLLIDRIDRGKGAMVDLQQAKKLAEEFQIFYAGGLTPENVTEIIKKVKPFAVDVAGGIETEGKEDILKIKQF